MSTMSLLRYTLLITIFIGSYSACQSQLEYGISVSGIQNYYKRTSNNGVQGLFAVSGASIAQSSLGFNFRLTYSIEEETSFSISPGVRFFKSFNDLDFSTHKATFYDLPAQINASIYEKWYIVAGITFSYLSSLYRENDFNYNPTREQDILSNAEHRFFFIPKLGIGTNIFDSINLELTYNLGMSNLVLLDNAGGVIVPPTSYKNNFLQLSFIYNGLGSLLLKKE